MSSAGPIPSEARGSDSRTRLHDVVHHIGHMLPAQGPIRVFIHHNPLHAFEHLPFERAVEQAAGIFGCEPFLPEHRYREALKCGRIRESDIDAVLAAHLDEAVDTPVVGKLGRHEVRRRILLYGLPELAGSALSWTLTETNTLKAFRTDLPTDLRQSLAGGSASTSRRSEADEVRALWSACQRAIQRTGSPPPRPSHQAIRHRDRLLASVGMDVDELIHPVLIRVTSAYLDQGLADWAMPGRERGLLACFLDLYRPRLARLCDGFGGDLQRVAREEAKAERDGWASLEVSLSILGIPIREWEPFLLAESLALRGFAGMVYQFEMRPDRVPVCSLPAKLVDFLATRMVLLRASLIHAARRVGFRGHLDEFRSWLGQRVPAPEAPSINDRAWPLFQLAQLSGLSAECIDELAPDAVDSIDKEIGAFDGATRRWLLHRAYERHLRHRFFDAVVEHRPRHERRPTCQAIFCLDDREESMRRHLEEVDPEIETFGAAGFHGVAMYYRGATDARARPLCPVAIQPRHYVAEVDFAGAMGVGNRLRQSWTRIGALFDKNIHASGRRARHGALLFATVGALWVLPLVLRVVFPWLMRGLGRLYGQLYSRRGQLTLEHDATASPPVGEQTGFTTTEMAEIVLSQLSPIGIRDRFAPLVLVLGHGSTSLNNPYESAYDCGACGGGRGGPNARAFAQMANDPAVRELAANRGLRIPRETWFIGGERNTSSNDVDLFDLDMAPAHVRPILRRARASFDEARRREAHERCRRFENAALWLPPAAALFHVQARATDLAQPRPEYGHATNAVCFIGRRRRTRGLFLDRRAFLVSYDPDGDAQGAALRRLLAAVVPVVAGINLEYFFGAVDPTGYGSGTKLPHNVTALIGVMNGAQSDLRTGLPWQTLEIHEPVRLSIVVEADASVLRRVLAQEPDLKRLVDHQWVFLAALDPTSDALVELDAAKFRPYQAEHTLRVGQGGSRRYYEGHRNHLPFAMLAHELARTP